MEGDNPFSKEMIEATALGPYAAKQPWQLELGQAKPEVPLAQGLGLGPDELRRLTDRYPELLEILEAPEAETLKTYLQAGAVTDQDTLNRLVLDLTDAFSKSKAPRPPSPPTPAAPPVQAGPTVTLPPEEPEVFDVPDTGPWWLRNA